MADTTKPEAPPSGSGPAQPAQAAPPSGATYVKHEGPKPASTAREGAQSVADAVKRVADAAVAEVSKVKVEEEGSDFTFAGTPGGRFVITAPGYGRFSTNGTVKLNGQQLHAFAWSSGRIQGNLPADAKPGDVEVAVDDKTKFTGKFKG